MAPKHNAIRQQVAQAVPNLRDIIVFLLYPLSNFFF